MFLPQETWLLQEKKPNTHTRFTPNTSLLSHFNRIFNRNYLNYKPILSEETKEFHRM